jgi:hypothetical protein
MLPDPTSLDHPVDDLQLLLVVAVANGQLCKRSHDLLVEESLSFFCGVCKFFVPSPPVPNGDGRDLESIGELSIRGAESTHGQSCTRKQLWPV